MLASSPLRALKVSVVVMGALIVVGTAALIAIIITRLAQGDVAEPAFSAAPIAIPAGARIEALSTAGPRAIVALALPTGARELIVIDLATGRRLGTIPLRPAP